MPNEARRFASILQNQFRRSGLCLALFCLLVGLTQLGAAQEFRNLFQFSLSSGSAPWAGVTRDAAGNLYGTTSGSGYDLATVYKLKRSQGGGWIMNPLFVFDVLGGPNGTGSWPWSGVVIGPDGALYGTTMSGGSQNDGVVYRLAPPPTNCRAAFCYWTETVLYSFTGGSDGNGPGLGNVIFDRAGNLYGTAGGGANPSCQAGCGVVYELSRSGSGWTEQVLYRFTGGNDGAGPGGTLLLDSAGNLYGTTVTGGGSGCQQGNGCGTVFELSPPGSGWTEKVLYRFQGSNDGANPYGGLISDHSGNLYGAANSKGAQDGGTVFELSPNGANWTFSLLYSLGPDMYGLGGPLGSLVMDSVGALYGVTYGDGANGTGSVFKLTPQNGSWTYTLLFSFDGGLGDPSGYEPLGTPILDGNGNIYGTASEGGTQECDFEVNCGTVWEVSQ